MVNKQNENAPKEIQLYSLYEIARKIETKTHTLQEWIDSSEIETPPAAFRTGSQFFWTEESIPFWKELVDKEIERLMNMKWSKEQLIDLLIEKAKQVESRAARAYPRGREMYSMQGARLKVVELEGIIEFIRNLGQSGLGTDEQRNEIFSSLRNAKSKLDMK